MKKSIRTLAFLSIIVFNSLAFAENSLQQIAAEFPSDNAYQVLEKFYSSLTTPAKMSEFDLITVSKSNQNCVAVNQSRPNYLYKVFITRYKSKIPRGPLFRNERKETLIYDLGARDGLLKYGEVIFMLSDISQTASDLFYSFPKRENFKINFRSNGTLIVFQKSRIDNNGIEYRTNGYCFRE